MSLKRKGFTLMEVLITMGLIGVVASLTMPALMMDGKKQQLGVKLAKFQTNVEHTMRAYAAVHGSVTTDKIAELFEDEFLYNNDFSSIDGYANVLRDGTQFVLYNNSEDHPASFSGSDNAKYGSGIKSILFYPMVPGLDGQTIFTFTITDQGFILPNGGDNCLQTLYNHKFQASKYYKTGSGEVCAIGSN